MNKNVIFSLCCYEDKTVEGLFKDRVLHRYKTLLKKTNIQTDFKIIDTIPEEINNRINFIRDFYNKKSNKKYCKWHGVSPGLTTP